MNIAEALATIAPLRGDAVVIATMTAGQFWPKFSRSERDFTHAAPMGAAGSIGLGIALGRPDLSVIVLDGDGSLRMNLGVLLTVGEQAPARLVHCVLENRVHGLTGGHPVSGAARIDALADMARAAGYRGVQVFDNTATLATGFATLLSTPGPHFVSLRVDAAFDMRESYAIGRSPEAQARQSPRGWRRLHDLLARS